MNRQSAFHSIFVIAASCLLASQVTWAAAADFSDIEALVVKQHDEGVTRLQEWIRLPSIAAEDVGFPEGPELMARMLKDAGFQKTRIIETDGKPGVFATLDAGAAKTLGVYFMYDVKQSDPSEWSSAPLAAEIVDKPGLGKAVMGRGAVNQKGPQAAFLASLHAIHAAGHKLPVNLVLVAEGGELADRVAPARARAADDHGVVRPRRTAAVRDARERAREPGCRR
ncbi:MAG TPA: hypothetical protein VJN01_02865, partial [Xanthomonadales bacterium]|nr:hypothetical protein [Xanthomonadales bacterium]